MITTTDVTTALKPIIENVFGFIPPDQFDFVPTIILERTENGTQSISVDIFTNLFQNAQDMSADSLLAIDNGKMGYAPFILEWQTKGYII